MSNKHQPSADGQSLIDILNRQFSNQPPPPFELELPDGSVTVFGVEASERVDGSTKPLFRYRLNKTKGIKALSSLDEYAIGVAFVNGDLDIEGDFLQALKLRKYFTDNHPLLSLWRYLRPLLRGQSIQNKTLVPRHYNHGNEFYFSFLDEQYQLYSQALYHHESEDLEQAATNKMEYICKICKIGPGSKILDIGAGWGSFSRYAAALGADITMLTVSTEQQKYLQAMIDESSLSGRMQVILEDIYKFESDQKFDAIVLLGVMEHLPNYQRLLNHFDKLLETDGRIYADFSAARKKFGISTFTFRYVFEGNGTPVNLPELISAANNGPYEVLEIRNDRHSYFLTLSAWAKKLEKNSEQLIQKFGERTYRLFRLYMWATAFTLGQNGALQSYRIVLQKCLGRPSETLGL